MSESDPDVNRRFPILSRGQDAKYQNSAEPPILSRLAGQHPALPSQGGWLGEEDGNIGHPNGRSSGFLEESDELKHDRHHGRHYLHTHGPSASNATGLHTHLAQVKNEEVGSLFSYLMSILSSKFCAFNLGVKVTMLTVELETRRAETEFSIVQPFHR